MKPAPLEFLRSEADFLAHLQAQLAGMLPGEIGRRFAKFAQYIFCHTEVGASFRLPEQRKETHDGGVDLEAQSFDGKSVAYIQSKYAIRSIDELDQIMSKFSSFETRSQQSTPQGSLFSHNEPSTTSKFVLITSSKIDGLMKKYSSSERPSLTFYTSLAHNGRFYILDSVAIFTALLNAYKRSTYLPTDVRLKFDTSFIRCGEVVVGVASVKQLRDLYQEFGDSLFLDNIREWLGPHGGKQTSKNNRESPNQAITKTLREAPRRFLARNNGLTIRAKRIIETDSTEVLLDEASIVNGCQTTMSIVDVGMDVDAKVVVKIVETDDSWDIAQAANFQTNLERMELELARDLRPQLVRAEAQRTGLKFASESEHRTAFSVVEELYDETITYEEFRSLFVGLFSRNPSNSFQSNYSELRQDLLGDLQKYEDREIFYERLFRIHIAVKEVAKAQYEQVDGTDVGELFQRFWKEEKAHYRSYIALVALAYLCEPEPSFPAIGFADLMTFITKAANKIESDPGALRRAYSCAFKAIALLVLQRHQDKKEQLQAMFGEIKNANFSNLLTQTRLIAS